MAESSHKASSQIAPAHEFLKTHPISSRSSSRKVKALISGMKQDGWNGPPVAVIEHHGEKYLLDGHHRVYAARKANLAVQYRSIGEEDLPKFGYGSIDQVIQAHAEAGHNRVRLR